MKPALSARVEATAPRLASVPRRRALFVLGAGLALGGCAMPRDERGEAIVATPGGERLTPPAVLHRMRAAEIVAMGELHDNPHHHAQRAALLLALPAPVPVVVEHLPRGAAPMLPAAARGEELLRALEAAGFDARGWRWPLHEPLFAAVARAGHELHGGNLPRDAARRVARDGLDAVPEDLRRLLDAAPLAASARSALEQDLLHGHCGHLSAGRVPGMVWAQRARDAAMTAALLVELDRVADRRVAGPVVLLAGNGHVRRDYGVPQLLAALRPQVRLLSIGFVESGGAAVPLAEQPHDIVWTTPAAMREDPCKAFVAPRLGGG
jgi:uncharacterized iron-regulated protein